jgi:hypothetical protein
MVLVFGVQMLVLVLVIVCLINLLITSENHQGRTHLGDSNIDLYTNVLNNKSIRIHFNIFRN